MIDDSDQNGFPIVSIEQRTGVARVEVRLGHQTIVHNIDNALLAIAKDKTAFMMAAVIDEVLRFVVEKTSFIPPVTYERLIGLGYSGKRN